MLRLWGSISYAFLHYFLLVMSFKPVWSSSGPFLREKSMPAESVNRAAVGPLKEHSWSGCRAHLARKVVCILLNMWFAASPWISISFVPETKLSHYTASLSYTHITCCIFHIEYGSAVTTTVAFTYIRVLWITIAYMKNITWIYFELLLLTNWIWFIVQRSDCPKMRSIPAIPRSPSFQLTFHEWYS